MPFTFLPFRRFPAECAVTYNAGVLPNEQCIEIPESLVRWFRGQEFSIETLAIKPHPRARLQDDVIRLMQESAEIVR
jgi:hypothetical protein